MRRRQTSIGYAKVIFAAIAGALTAVPALAHHSFSMFDQRKLTKIDGTVKEYEYISPHAWLHLAVPTADGKSVEWAFEMGGVGQLNRDGWNRDTVKVGDKVSVEFHPLRDGSQGGQFRAIIFADGKRMCQAGAGNEHCKS